MLYIDVDRFKLLNDMYGHSFGDRVLIEVASRLRSAVREEDLVGRLAGDEFVVVAPGISAEDAEGGAGVGATSEGGGNESPGGWTLSFSRHLSTNTAHLPSGIPYLPGFNFPLPTRRAIVLSSWS